jgi:cell wall-associated NlpC family hydrolase
MMGVPYRLGGDEPAGGFDCSGLVRYVFEQHQLEVPRTVAEQYRIGRRIGQREIQPGDLVFFSTTGRGATHVGIATGSGEFVHAPGTGQVVRVERYDTPYWRGRFVGARSVTRSPSS